jgi:hypothetical protein
MLVHKLFPFPNLFSVYGNVAAKINYDLLAAFIKNENNTIAVYYNSYIHFLLFPAAL